MERVALKPAPPRSLPGWLALFGPGAIIASLTIGSGELIFSSRAGALFEYRLLWFFLLVLLLKWALVVQTARHMVLTGAHPFQRWMDLPGPRGWLPLIFLFFAIVCFPIWVSFHAGTLGTLFRSLFGTDAASAHFLWGFVALGAVLTLSLVGGYALLEKAQLTIVLMMLAGVTISLFLLNPAWTELLHGFWPQSVFYPEWALKKYALAERPIWVETITYVGVLGGSGYDYLAYVSYLRAKGWGQAGGPITAPSTLAALDHHHPTRRWIKAVYLDASLSFLAVLIFTVVFVAAGATVLTPQQEIPAGSDLLQLQAQFVTPLHNWLRPVYFAGAFLTMLGTLYGTLEVAPAVYKEFRQAFGAGFNLRQRQAALGWCATGGAITLLFLAFARGTPPALIELITPANLFTGVLACGFICWLALWSDHKFLPPHLRAPWPLQLLNLIAGLFFLLLGFKTYWDKYGWVAVAVLAPTVGAGILAAFLAGQFRRARR